ncbi:MAG: L-2-hydroxyglutarate oxidase [Chloroflexi bacterium]|nr:L-2-hydroxyglutarate oxidase [Chloroflexota bacterium]
MAAGYDVAVIGAGIIGLATAREILRRRPGCRLVVLEKETAVGSHQTGHNSGVIHSGIYYASGSLKARACVAGASALMRYCEERGVPYERSGKVIVATAESELPRLEGLYRRGIANGVPGLELIGPERLRELEPHVVGIRAIWSPNTGIVDYSHVASALAEDVRSADGEIRTGSEVVGIRRQPNASVVETARGDSVARSIVTCAGLYADRVAALAGGSHEPRIVPFRGDYYLLQPQCRHLVRSLIYPVPDPTFPFLGVHFTRHLNGDVSLGPNAVLALAREGYRRTDVAPRELLETLSYPGFVRLAARYWRVGLAEIWRDLSKRAFLTSLRVYVPELTAADLLPGPSGVRAQALANDGKLIDDFVIEQSGGLLHVRNAPSPAATSSLVIASMIADALEQGG